MDRYRSSVMCSLGAFLGYTIRLAINAGFIYFIWKVLRSVLHL
jgi:hypothetical protein